MQHGGHSVASLEIVGNGVVVQVNGKIYQKSACVHLRGGDEVVFTTFEKHAYVSFCKSVLHSVIRDHLLFIYDVVTVVMLS